MTSRPITMREGTQHDQDKGRGRGTTVTSCRVPVSQNDARRDGDIVSRPRARRGKGNDEEKWRGMGVASRPRMTRRWGRTATT